MKRSLSEQERPWQRKIVQDIMDAFLKKNKKLVALAAPVPKPIVELLGEPEKLIFSVEGKKIEVKAGKG